MSEEKAIKKSKGQEWLDSQVLTDDRRERIKAACAGSGVAVEKLEALLARAVIDNPALMKCTPASLFSSMMSAAELGLSPSGHHNGAYFATYKDQCKLGLGYGAMVDLATRTGRIRSFKVEAVWRDDFFEVEAGTANKINHRPNYANRQGDPVLYYAVAFFTDGGHEFEVMTKPEIDRIRGASRNADAPPWKFQFTEMAKKTVLRRLMKRLPLQPQLAEAVADTDLVDGFEYGRVPGTPETDRADRMSQRARRVTNTADQPEPGRDAGEAPSGERGPTDADLATQPAFDPDELDIPY